MQRKRTLALLLVICLFAMIFTACGGSSSPSPASSAASPDPAASPSPAAPSAPAEKPTVTLWTTGSQNLSDLFTKAIEEYNSLPDAKCKMELQFLMSGTGDTVLYDRLAAAFKSNQTDAGFDIIAENSTSLFNYEAVAGSPDVFLPVDFPKIPNFANVQVETAFHKDKSVPYRITTVVFAYDEERLPNPPKTWDELLVWVKKNPGRFAYNPPASGGAGAGFVRTAVYRTLPKEAWTSDDPKWMEQWGAGMQYLTDLHPHLYSSGGSVVYPNKNQGTIDLLINKEVDIIPAWADQIMQNIDQGTLPVTTKMTNFDIPLSGTDVVFTFPSVGSHQEEAYDFVNFMLSPQGQKLCLETIFAVPVIDISGIDSPAKAAVEGLDISNMSIIALGDLGSELNDKWDAEIATLG